MQPDGSRRLIGALRRNHLVAARALRRRRRGPHPERGRARRHRRTGRSRRRGIVRDPRWSPSRFRIAYRSGDSLRVVHADGTHDSLFARGVAPVPPAWSPLGAHQLAYLDAGGGLRVIDADSREALGSAPGAAGGHDARLVAVGLADPRSLAAGAAHPQRRDRKARRPGPPRPPAGDPPTAGATLESAAFSTRGPDDRGDPAAAGPRRAAPAQRAGPLRPGRRRRRDACLASRPASRSRSGRRRQPPAGLLARARRVALHPRRGRSRGAGLRAGLTRVRPGHGAGRRRIPARRRLVLRASKRSRALTPPSSRRLRWPGGSCWNNPGR